MTFLDQFPFLSLPASGPAALMLLAVFATALLARPRRARTDQSVVKRRLGLPRGVARWLVISVLTIAALPLVGIDLEGLWSTVMAALSLIAIGFVAMWSILSHMLASVLIVVFRPFEVGDRVAVVGDDPVIGQVLDLNPVYTTLRADDGDTLQVPNNLFFQKVVKRQAAAPAEAAPSSSSLNPAAS